jgi:hypothetical protein
MPSVITVPPEAQPSVNFSADSATEAYLAEIFFDHPSGRNRIHDAMTWKAENLRLFEGNSATAK